jgi:hypothetical protein
VSLTGGTASFDTAEVGVGKTVTLVGATLTGSASANYNLTSVGTATANITAPAPSNLALVVSNQTNILITWSAVSNGNYRVSCKSDLSAATWADLTGDVLANGDNASKVDLLTTTNRFYRVGVVP